MPEDGEQPTRSNSISAAINYLHLDADKILTAFGKYGRYQMLAYAVTGSVQILFALNMMIMPFITTSAVPTCHIPDSLSTFYASIPNDGCHVLNLQNNETVSCLEVNGAQYSYNVSKYSSIATHYDLVCDKQGMADHATSIFLFGGMLVSPFVSQMSDIFGRRYTFLIPLYITTIANIFCVFAPTYWFFLCGRFISGVATTSFSMTGYILAVESVSTEFRDLIPVMSTFSWVLGYMLAGVFSLFISDWRGLYFAASIPGILTIPFYWFTPESIHWLMTKQDDKKIKKYINTSVAFNKQTICLKSCRSPNAELDKSAKGRTFLALFYPKIFVHLVINSYILMVMSGTYWALSLYSTELSDDGSKAGYFWSGFVELPAGLVSVFFLIHCKRKFVSFISLLLTAIFMLLTVSVPMNDWTKMAFPLLAKSANSIVWSSQPLLYSEGTPTTIRNVFGGVVSLLGEFGSIGAPYMNRLTAINKDAPAILISVLTFIAAFLVTLQPETKNKKLPEDIDDFDAGPLFRGCKFGKKGKESEGSEQENDVEMGKKVIEEAVELLEAHKSEKSVTFEKKKEEEKDKEEKEMTD